MIWSFGLLREPSGRSSSTYAAELPHAGTGPSVSGTLSQIGTFFCGLEDSSSFLDARKAPGRPAGLEGACLGSCLGAILASAGRSSSSCSSLGANAAPGLPAGLKIPDISGVSSSLPRVLGPFLFTPEAALSATSSSWEDLASVLGPFLFTPTEARTVASTSLEPLSRDLGPLFSGRRPGLWSAYSSLSCFASARDLGPLVLRGAEAARLAASSDAARSSSLDR